MTEAYKVGVAFAMENLVSAQLIKIAEEFGLVNKAAKEFSATLKSLGGIGGIAGAEILSGMSKSAQEMGSSFQFAAVEIDGVRQKLMGLKTASAGGIGGGKNTGFWGSHAGMAQTALWGAAAYAGYGALKNSMSMEDTIARAMIAAGLPVGPGYMYSDHASTIQKSILDTSTGFGVDQKDTQEAALQTMRALAPLTPAQREALLPSIMKFAGAEVLGKHGTTMEEAAEAGIGLAHQLRAYTPEQIEPLLGAFAKLSMASPQSLSQMSRAASYYLPLLTAGLGMDPTELMALGTVGSQMGLNTKSGTWLANMFTAPFTSDLTSKRGSARRSALQELGIVNADGKATTKDPFEFLRILAAHSQNMTPEARLKDFVAAFGKEGARAAAIYTDPAVLKNTSLLAQGLKSAPTPDALKTQYGNSPMVQFDKTWQEFTDTLTKIGENVLPMVTDGLMGLIYPLKLIQGILDGMDWVAKEGAGGIRSLFGLGGPAVPPASGVTITPGTTVVKIKEREIGRAVTNYQFNGMASAPAGGSLPDYTLSTQHPN